MPSGIPFCVAEKGQKRVPVKFEYAGESDPGPYPIPDDAPIEGGPKSDGDRHVLIIDPEGKKLYELFSTYKTAERLEGGLGSHLRSDEQSPAAGRLDLGRCRRAAGFSRPGSLRRSEPRRNSPCAAVYDRAFAAGLHQPGHALGQFVERSESAADGPAAAVEGRR